MAIYLCGFAACESDTHVIAVERSLSEFDFLHPITGPALERDSHWWVNFIPRGLGRGVPCDTDQMRQQFGPNASELISRIYRHFAERADFKILLVGWEAGDAMFDPAETEHVQLGGIRFPEVLYAIEGLVLSDELYDLHEQKARFTPFSKGYHWIPYTDGQWESPFTRRGITKR